MANNSKRPSFNLVVFEEKYGRGEDEMTALNSRAFRKRGCIESVRKRLAKKRLKPGEFIMNRIPFINLIRTYKLSYLLKDIIAGLTVGVIQIAPTMANATTAELPPINGLYVAFFSVIAYLIFGTSKHLSLGTHGVISIMVGNALKNFEGILYPDDDELDNGLVANQTDPNYISNNPEEAKILISMMLSFQAGAIQIILGLINGGFISKYLSDTLVEAFTIGSSYLIVVSQIGTILGITVHRMKLPFKMIDTLIGAFRQIKNIQPMSISLSLGAMLIIFLVRKYVNERFRKRLPAPIPIELIVVIVATALSFWLNLGEKYNLHLVGHVPLGIPQPKLPPFRIFSMLFVEGFSIALVSFALNVSMGKLFAKKYNYHINVNQELFAYGVGNMMSSLFNGMPAAGGLTRTLIVETTGAKTQMFSIVSSAFVLIVIVGLGFLFRYLPYCCLASIIVISLFHKCLEVTRIARLLRNSLSESIIWLSTFLGVVILDIDYGLYIGLAVSIISVVVKSQLARVSILGRIDETNIYEPINNYPKAREHDMIKIIRFEDSIYYANVENFSNSVLNTLEINYEQVLEQLNDLKKTVDKQGNTTDTNNLEKGVVPKNEFEVERAKILSQIAIHHAILDCSCVNFIDLMGVNGLIQMCEYLKKFDIKLHLTCMKPSIIKTLKRMDDGNKLDMTKIYPTIEDAVQTILTDEPEKQHHEAPIYE